MYKLMRLYVLIVFVIKYHTAQPLPDGCSSLVTYQTSLRSLVSTTRFPACSSVDMENERLVCEVTTYADNMNIFCPSSDVCYPADEMPGRHCPNKTCYPLRHVYDNAAIQYDCVCQPPQRNIAILAFPEWTKWRDTLPNQHLNSQRRLEGDSTCVPHEYKHQSKLAGLIVLLSKSFHCEARLKSFLSVLLTVIVNEMSAKNEDLQMFGLKLNKYE